jgi:hypothetical protein
MSLKCHTSNLITHTPLTHSLLPQADPPSQLMPSFEQLNSLLSSMSGDTALTHAALTHPDDMGAPHLKVACPAAACTLIICVFSFSFGLGFLGPQLGFLLIQDSFSAANEISSEIIRQSSREICLLTVAYPPSATRIFAVLHPGIHPAQPLHTPCPHRSRCSPPRSPACLTRTRAHVAASPRTIRTLCSRFSWSSPSSPPSTRCGGLRVSSQIDK